LPVQLARAATGVGSRFRAGAARPAWCSSTAVTRRAAGQFFGGPSGRWGFPGPSRDRDQAVPARLLYVLGPAASVTPSVVQRAQASSGSSSATRGRGGEFAEPERQHRDPQLKFATNLAPAQAAAAGGCPAHDQLQAVPDPGPAGADDAWRNETSVRSARPGPRRMAACMRLPVPRPGRGVAGRYAPGRQGRSASSEPRGGPVCPGHRRWPDASRRRLFDGRSSNASPADIGKAAGLQRQRRQAPRGCGCALSGGSRSQWHGRWAGDMARGPPPAGKSGRKRSAEPVRRAAGARFFRAGEPPRQLGLAPGSGGSGRAETG